MPGVKLAAVLLATLFALGPAGRPLAGEDDNHHPAVPVPACTYPAEG